MPLNGPFGRGELGIAGGVVDEAHRLSSWLLRSSDPMLWQESRPPSCAQSSVVRCPSSIGIAAAGRASGLWTGEEVDIHSGLCTRWAWKA